MLKDKLMKKLEKKGAKDLQPAEKQAKMGVIKELSRQAGAALNDKVHPLKKVSVASDSKAGLKEGLAKASGLIDHAPGMEHDPDKIVEGAEEGMHADLDHDNEAGEAHDHIAKVLGEGSPAEEDSESPEMEALEQEHGDKSPEELDAHIQKLLALKSKKEAGHA